MGNGLPGRGRLAGSGQAVAHFQDRGFSLGPLMRRERRIPPARGFRSSDWMRLFSMLLMLGVLYMLWDWARQPGTWRWFANEANSEEAGG